MTPLLTHFSTYSPCPSNKKISTTDGSLITVAGQGNVQISPTIILQNVLCIPKLSASLISIQKLTKDLSCNVVFLCVIVLVFFRTRIQGGRFVMLENGMVFIILITRISSAPPTFPTIYFCFY